MLTMKTTQNVVL